MTRQSHFWAYIWEKHDPKRHMCPNSHCSTVYNSQDMHACKLSNFSCVQLFVTLWAEPCWDFPGKNTSVGCLSFSWKLPDSGIEPNSLTSAKTWKQPKCPLTEEWIKIHFIYIYIYIYIYTYTHTHTYNGILLWKRTHEKEWNYALCSNMYGPR